MFVVEESIVIDRAANEVFAQVSDQTNAPRRGSPAPRSLAASHHRWGAAHSVALTPNSVCLGFERFRFKGGVVRRASATYPVNPPAWTHVACRNSPRDRCSRSSPGPCHSSPGTPLSSNQKIRKPRTPLISKDTAGSSRPDERHGSKL
jgi:hypothetical protein